MSLFPLVQLLPHVAQLRLIASDVDGTLTQNEQFTPELFKAIAQLNQANLPLLLVTGRSAGWVDALRHYLPVAGAIAENGGVYFAAEGPYQVLSDIPDLAHHRQQLADRFGLLQQQYPQLKASADNPFRITDWTFDVAGLTPIEIAAIARQCVGWSFTYSTVQCHIKPVGQDKARGLQQVLRQAFPALKPCQVLTVGDSPNDEAMFDPRFFPVSVGVANILAYRDRLQHLPQYVTAQSEVSGFCELAALLTGGCSYD
jgi:hydroxymethylpyrimidine pyrophosphatase-like HAD family hydrolase